MPKVSVLMPVYKTEESYLREAIESILNQTFSDFEFLILDDCPDDDREKIVKSYKDKRIKYTKNERNLGITPSRNKLIDMAKGEYLAIFDHDDISLPTRLEKEVKFLDENIEYGVVSSWTKHSNKDKFIKHPITDHDIKVALIQNCELAHSAAMVRKSILDDNNIRYEADFSPSEDYRLWFRLAKLTKFHNIPEVLFIYRWHDNNTSISQANKMMNMTWRIRALFKAEFAADYQEFISKAKHTANITLFGFIPFLKIIKQQNKTKVYLFEKILLAKIKTSSRLGEK